MPTELMTTAAVADRFGVDVRTVNRWANAGRLTPTIVVPGKRGARLYDPRDVELFALTLEGKAS